MPAFFLALGWTVGIVAAPLVTVGSLSLRSAVSLALIPLFFTRGRRAFIPIFVAFLALVAVLFWRHEQERPLDAIENRVGLTESKVSVEGVVVSFPQVSTRGKRERVAFDLDARNLLVVSGGHSDLVPVQGKVRVSLFSPGAIPGYGDRVRVWGQLTTPKAALNPGLFDYGQYLKQQGIYCTLYGFGRKSIRVLNGHGALWPLRVTFEWRQLLAKRFYKLFDPETAVFLNAVVLGLSAQIDRPTRELFAKTGTAHILPTASRKWDYNPFANHLAAKEIAYLF
ncbi:MAG: ComEC/Rec2 family competence protein [Candidatus Omnitrophota bacterium]|nr:ComEC/Rec2 family competence protein [Candidatus Omnitrophota bacterium]